MLNKASPQSDEAPRNVSTLVEATLARRIEEVDGTRTLIDLIIDRQEFTCHVPSTFEVVLGFIIEGEPEQIVNLSVVVLSHMHSPIWSASEPTELGLEGKSEVYLPIKIPVLDVGPCYILLKFNNSEVWRQRIFFARKLEDDSCDAEDDHASGSS